MNFNRLFNDFADKLSKRTKFLTEDSVRYIFFSCLLEQEPNLDCYILEKPYSDSYNTKYGKLKLTDHELDLSFDNYAFEFKFDKNPNGTNSANPNRAGALFNDIKRLEIINEPETVKYLVYVTDDEMHNYLLGEENNRGAKSENLRIAFEQFYKAPVDGKSFFFCVDDKLCKNKTFFKNMSASFEEAHSEYKIEMECVFSKDFISLVPNLMKVSDKNLHIRIYKIY